MRYVLFVAFSALMVVVAACSPPSSGSDGSTKASLSEEDLGPFVAVPYSLLKAARSQPQSTCKLPAGVEAEFSGPGADGPGARVLDASGYVLLATGGFFLVPQNVIAGDCPAVKGALQVARADLAALAWWLMQQHNRTAGFVSNDKPGFVVAVSQQLDTASGVTLTNDPEMSPADAAWAAALRTVKAALQCDAQGGKVPVTAFAAIDAKELNNAGRTAQSLTDLAFTSELWPLMGPASNDQQRAGLSLAQQLYPIAPPSCEGVRMKGDASVLWMALGVGAIVAAPATALAVAGAAAAAGTLWLLGQGAPAMAAVPVKPGEDFSVPFADAKSCNAAAEKVWQRLANGK